jgi:hypothetical protein
LHLEFVNACDERRDLTVCGNIEMCIGIPCKLDGVIVTNYNGHIVSCHEFWRRVRLRVEPQNIFGHRHSLPYDPFPRKISRSIPLHYFDLVQGVDAGPVKRRGAAWCLKDMLRALLPILLVACARSPVDTVTPDVACDEQATTWCDALGYPTSGCHQVYTTWCAPWHPREISLASELACLDAIPLQRDHDLIPKECLATW